LALVALLLKTQFCQRRVQLQLWGGFQSRNASVLAMRGIKMITRLAVILAALVLMSGFALAHSELSQSVPANKAVLASPPSQFELTFANPAEVTATRLFAADGSEVALEVPETLGATSIYQFPSPQLPTGKYRLEWRAISADGHDVGGTIVFTVSGP
jgi:methionine-rich copper-binding protein CopC